MLRVLALAAALLAPALWAAEPAEPAETADAAQVRAEPGLRDKVLAQARAALGTPYRFGGKGQGDFDCSGLVRWIYTAAEMDLPHSAREMLALGTRIELAEAQPGDLLVFDWSTETRNRLHVAILLPEGEIIHASPKHRQVRAVALDNPTWKDRLIAVIRLLP